MQLLDAMVLNEPAEQALHEVLAELLQVPAAQLAQRSGPDEDLPLEYWPALQGLQTPLTALYPPEHGLQPFEPGVLHGTHLPLLSEAVPCWHAAFAMGADSSSISSSVSSSMTSGGSGTSHTPPGSD